MNIDKKLKEYLILNKGEKYISAKNEKISSYLKKNNCEAYYFHKFLQTRRTTKSIHGGYIGAMKDLTFYNFSKNIVNTWIYNIEYFYWYRKFVGTFYYNMSKTKFGYKYYCDDIVDIPKMTELIYSKINNTI